MTTVAELRQRAETHDAQAQTLRDQYAEKALPPEAAETIDRHRKAAHDYRLRIRREEAVSGDRPDPFGPTGRASAKYLRHCLDTGARRDYVEASAVAALTDVQEHADRLGRDAAARERRGRPPLASEARAVRKARDEALALSDLLDHMQPVRRLSPLERFPQ